MFTIYSLAGMKADFLERFALFGKDEALAIFAAHLQEMMGGLPVAAPAYKPLTYRL